MKVFCAILLLVTSVSYGQQSPSMFEVTYKPKELKKDIQFVKQQLEEKHPALYLYIEKSRLNSKFDSLENSIKKPLTLSQFRHKLACVLASIGDGHMSLQFDQDNLTNQDKRNVDGTKVLPLKQLEYEIVEGRLFVAKSYDTMITRGTEITAIDGKPVAEVLSSLTAAMPSDGYNRSFKYHVLKKAMLADLYYMYYGYKDTTMLYLKEGGSSSTVSLVSSPEPEKFRDPHGSSLLIWATGIPETQEDAPASLEIRFFNKDFDQMMIDFFALLKKKGRRSLVLDLRGNMGGEHSSMIKLFSYLIDKPTYFARVFNRDGESDSTGDLGLGTAAPVLPSANHFDGTLYVYVDEGTFSAASLLAGSLQAIKRGTIVGRETGGGRNGSVGGTYVQSILPHSELLFRFGEKLIEVPGGTELTGHGVMPDATTYYTVDDFLRGEDLEHKWLVGQLWPEAYKKLWPD